MIEELETPATTETATETTPAQMERLTVMAKAGVLYGRKKSKTHPRMQQYIYATRNGIEILDIEQTTELLQRANAFLAEVAKAKGIILFVGTTPAAKDATRSIAEQFSYPFVTERWLGGTLTNFKTLRTRIQHFIKLKADRISGRLEKYTKKERVEFDKEIERMTTLFGGIEKLTELPKALVVANAAQHMTAIREAKRLQIPVVAVMSNDVNPDIIEYPIPANDRARSSIAWVLAEMQGALAAAGASRPAEASEEKAQGV
jgi:small subunit ribosomal protein S2